jgi:hypothetical protein
VQYPANKTTIVDREGIVSENLHNNSRAEFLIDAARFIQEGMHKVQREIDEYMQAVEL